MWNVFVVLTLRRGKSVRQENFDFSVAKSNINMQSNKVTLDNTVSVATRHFSGLSLGVELVFPNSSAVRVFLCLYKVRNVLLFLHSPHREQGSVAKQGLKGPTGHLCSSYFVVIH